MSMGTPVSAREKNPRAAFQSKGSGGFLIFVGPGVQLTSECKESCSCQEILEFWRWCWHVAGRDFVSSDSGERDAMPLGPHVRRILLEMFGEFVYWEDGITAKRSLSNSGRKRFVVSWHLSSNERRSMWQPVRPRFSSTLVKKRRSFVSGSRWS